MRPYLYKAFPCLCVLLFITQPAFSQAYLYGSVSYFSSDSSPAAGVHISAFGANSVYTTDDGLFRLTFPYKKPGDLVKLNVGSKDKAGNALELVNAKEIGQVHLPHDPENSIVEIFVCRAGERDRAMQQYYGIISNKPMQLPAPVEKTRPGNKPRKDYALFIVNTEYDFWPGLPGSEQEIREIAASLENNYGFSKPDIRINLNKSQMLATLEEYQNRVFEEDDQLLVFFSMHGDYDEAIGAVIPKDGKLKDPTYESWITHPTLEAVLTKIKCKHILFALDACYSGTFGAKYKNKPPTPPWEDISDCNEKRMKALTYKSRLYLSSGGKERTPAKSQFARKWLDALRQQSSDGILGFHELYEVLSGAFPTPMFGEFLGNQSGGNFIFVDTLQCFSHSPPQKVEEQTPETPVYESRVTNATGINLNSSDYAPVYYDNGIVFVSSRGRKKAINGESFDELYFSAFDPNGILGSPEKFAFDDLSSFDLHQGPVCFTRDYKTAFVSRNNNKNGVIKGGKDGKSNQKIYQLKYGFPTWTQPIDLPFNSDDYSCMHPSLTPDGRSLYFASNMPGGFGGFDIYVVERTAEGWGKPQNLGPSINTDKQELFPFMSFSGSLFFSSNGRSNSLGGMDIYSVNNPLKMEEEKEVVNLGAPINSEANDFGIIMEDTGKTGYFSSERSPGYGKSDIYSFVIEKVK